MPSQQPKAMSGSAQESGELARHYDDLWQEACVAFEAGAPSLDRQLLHRAADRRRSATLIIRPSAAVVAAVAEVLAELQLLEPHQHYYRADELHVTLLSLWTGTEQPEPFWAQMPIYRCAIDGPLAAAQPFTLRFDGLSASPGAILVQGFPQGPELHGLRNALRAAIHAEGLGQNIDRRYRIRTAHMTAIRFSQPLRDLGRFAARLQELRRCDFGSMQVDEVQLVANDWYMSHDSVRLLHTYPLGQAPVL